MLRTITKKIIYQNIRPNYRSLCNFNINSDINNFNISKKEIKNNKEKLKNQKKDNSKPKIKKDKLTFDDIMAFRHSMNYYSG